MKTKAEKNQHLTVKQNLSSTQDSIQLQLKHNMSLKTNHKMIMEERSKMPQSYHLVDELQRHAVIASKMLVLEVESESLFNITRRQLQNWKFKLNDSAVSQDTCI